METFFNGDYKKVGLEFLRYTTFLASKHYDDLTDLLAYTVNSRSKTSKQPILCRNNCKELSSVTGKQIELVFIRQKIGLIIKRRERNPIRL